MNKIVNQARQVPVHATADALIIGGTAAGVALALGLKQRGFSVFLTSSRPYLGEDLCGDMLLWPGAEALPEGGLTRALYPHAPHPSTPMHLKLTLEQSMVEAGIPFLLNTHPARALEDPDHRKYGMIFATRSGLLAIQAARVLDRTDTLAEASLRGRQCVLHTTLCMGEGTDAEGVEIVDRPEGFSGEMDGNPWSLSARTYRLEVDFGDGSLREMARAESEIIARCWVPGEYLHQERIRPEAGLAPVLDGIVKAEEWAQTIDPVNSTGTGRSTVPFDPGQVPLLGRWEVLVLGGGTGGAPAAIAAARAGADTIVIESTDLLGGVGTSGQITRYWFGNKTGFTSEIDAGVNALETEKKIIKSKSEWSRSAKAEWYRRQCNQAGATVLFRSLCADVRREADKVDALLVATPYGFGYVEAACIVDATGNADVAAAAGAPVRTIGAEHVAVQGTGLAGMQPGRDYHNSDHNFCDDSSITDTTAFLVSSKLKFKDHFDAGQLVDSRERRQIIGEIELDPVDFLAERRYPDTICVASSNFDTHGFTIHPVFLCKPMEKKRMWADVPFRALQPKGLANVLVTGLGLSAHRDALPVIRMQPDVQNHGYAAGHAAAIAAKEECSFHDLPIRELQAHLVKIGNLPERVLSDTDSFPVPDEAMVDAVQRGWDSHKGLALIFSDPARSIPLIRAALREDLPGERKLRYSLILCLLGEPEGIPDLARFVQSNEWDEGWNYTGMGQFGLSLSPVDAHLIALGHAADAGAWEAILDKIISLPQDPPFSHCRAVAEACEGLHQRHPDKRAAQALATLLQRPGMAGHHQPDIRAVQAALTADPNETAVRNRALRELHLARALYRCGDHHGLGEKILRHYAADLRAHFARHAQAVLARA
ncbi:MAG: FAD-dependent oxidoreductase [Oceanipulchritudo sp.]